MASQPPQAIISASSLPWLKDPLEQLLARRGQLHHALLIHGPDGIGKGQLATALAASLLCEQTDTASPIACGQCQSCHWFGERSHPDYRSIRPEISDPDFVPSRARKPSREIRVDQIRALSRFMAVGSHRNGWKIVCIDPADAMNHVTANGLLKTLEEPSAQTLLILVSSHPDRLAATIRSRCRLVPVSGPDADSASQWLATTAGVPPAQAVAAIAAAGAPLHALEIVEPDQATAHRAILEAIASVPDTPIVGVVDALDSHDPLQWAQVLRRWLGDLARVKAGAQARYFPDRSDRFSALASRTQLDRITALQQQLGDLEARIEHPLNPRLICESTLFAYSQLYEPSAR